MNRNVFLAAILEKANYLSYYARSKNGPSRNGFYGKNYLRNSSKKFGGDENLEVGVFALSTM